MKHLSSRWVGAARPVSFLIIAVILLIGIATPAAWATNKGSLQVSFTGSIASTSGFTNYQSVLLNVISVRLNPSTNLGISPSDPSWQTISVPSGTTADQSNPNLSFGGDFGPNGNAVGVGQGRVEIQIDLAQLQNNVMVFNTGLIKAKTYNQIEVVLDSQTPGIVVPQCSFNGLSAGEGCINYAMALPSDFGALRAPATVTVTRGHTALVTIDLQALLGAPPFLSTDVVPLTPGICVVPLAGGSSSCPPSPNFTGFALDSIAGTLSGTVTGGTNHSIVNAELVGTDRIISSVKVDKKTFAYSMTLPAPGNYDFYTSGQDRTIDAVSNFPITTGVHTLNFTVTQKPTLSITGKVVDACSGLPVPGAVLDIYAPPSQVGSQDCTTNPSPPCTTTCDSSALPNPQVIQNGCVIVASSSTDGAGAFPQPGSAQQPAPFRQIPGLVGAGNDYAIRATASGYNGAILPAETISIGGFRCKSSGFLKPTNNTCSFSLEHGEIDVTTALTAVNPTPVVPLNILVEAEDHGTSNGEGVGLATVSAGSSQNTTPLAIFVPDSTTPVPTSTATPIVINGPSSYDLFGSTLDLFGAVPQKDTGHTIGVLSNVPAPARCASGATGSNPAPQATVTGFQCVGHGSFFGTVTQPDQNTQIITSKADASGNDVALITTQVAPVGSQGGGKFAVCAPVDTYDVAQVETQPTGTPAATVAPTAAVTLTGPLLINSTPTSSPTPPACQGICSDFPANTNGKTCLLCQGTIPNPAITFPGATPTPVP